MGQVQIFDAPTDLGGALNSPEVRGGIQSIAEQVGAYRKNKHLNELSLKIAESQGHKDQAQLYKMALQQDPSKLLQMLQLQDIMKGGGQEGPGANAMQQGAMQQAPMQQGGLGSVPAAPGMQGQQAPQMQRMAQEPGEYNPRYNADQLQAVSAINPGMGNALTQQEGLRLRQHEAGVNRHQKEKEFDLKKKEAVGKRYNKVLEKYDDGAREAEKGITNVETAIALNEKMNTTPGSWDSFVRSLESPFLSQFISVPAQQLEGQAPALLSGFREKMGGVLTNAKIDLIAKKIASVGKDKTANRLLLYLDYFDRKLDIQRQSEAAKITAENEGFAPADFNQRMHKAMKPYQQQVNKDIDRLIKGENVQSEFAVTGLQMPERPKSAKEGAKLMRSPGKAIGWVDPENIEKARKGGYTEVSSSEQ